MKKRMRKKDEREREKQEVYERCGKVCVREKLRGY